MNECSMSLKNVSGDLPCVCLGLFAYSHMDFEADREASPTQDPSLADMTRMALNILQKNPEGFFLFVEGKSSVCTFIKFSGFHRRGVWPTVAPSRKAAKSQITDQLSL